MTFSCVSCRVSGMDTAAHRAHYRTEWHRYNLKRKVAHLPPLTEEAFDGRVRQLREAAGTAKTMKSASCRLCHKSFKTPNQLKHHIRSKKHKAAVRDAGEDSLRAGISITMEDAEQAAAEEAEEAEELSKESAAASEEAAVDWRAVGFAAATIEGGKAEDAGDAHGAAAADAAESKDGDAAAMAVVAVATEEADEDGDAGKEAEGDEDEQQQAELAAAEALLASTPCPLGPTDCLFSSERFATIEENVEHMERVYSFFIPAKHLLSDLPGLLAYLAAKVSLGFICLWCNGRGKAFHSLEAVRAHMIDKGHCRMRFEKEDMEEYDRFYQLSAEDDEEESTGLMLDPLTDELIRADGSRIGHRQWKRYYLQRFADSSEREDVIAVRRDKMARFVGDEAARELIVSSTLGVLPPAERKKLEVARGKLAGKAARDIRREIMVGVKTNKLNGKFMSHR